MDVVVEVLGSGDWERARALRLRALRDAPDAFARTLAEEEAQPPEFWRERLAGDSARTFFATSNGSDVGMATAAAYRGRERTAGLFGMWVAPEARRLGVGRALVQAVVEWSKRGPFDVLLLEVADDNAPAVALYARMGFEPTGNAGTLPEPRTHITEHERALALR